MFVDYKDPAEAVALVKMLRNIAEGNDHPRPHPIPKALNKKAAEILLLQCEGYGLTDISNKFGVSVERVRTIRTEGVNALKRYVSKDVLA